MSKAQIERVTNILAVKTYYEYSESNLLESVNEKGYEWYSKEHYVPWLTVMFPTFHNETEIVKLSNVLLRTMITLVETDRFNVLWNDKKSRIIDGLSVEYFKIITNYISNRPNDFDSQFMNLGNKLTFEERFNLRETSP